MGRQGIHLSEDKIQRIKYLLENTENTIKEIAIAVGTSKGAVLTVNRKFDIRKYNGRRAEWTTNGKRFNTGVMYYKDFRNKNDTM